ncbi:MAG: lipid-A-disaccharide synthase [Gemmatimonadota bacterium]|nr:lipid-A-disaccharide synthase [Gemmatimonadota bacterium]
MVAMGPSGSDIFISAGETSGDMHAARMLTRLKSLEPGFSFSGIGGEAMSRAGVRLLAGLDRLAVMGLVEVVRHLGFFRRLLGEIEAHLHQARPRLVVLVDFPDFNFRIARIAKRAGIPVLYYISPQIWAWRTGRRRTLAHLADRLAVVFPFEVEFYRDQPLEVEFVGHPLIETLDEITPRAEFLRRYGLDETRPLVGLMPGSRGQEIRRHLGVFLQAAALMIEQQPGLQFATAFLPHTEEALSRSHRKALSDLGVACVRGDSRALVAHSRLLITKSGTTTMEAALCGTPMVIGYRTSAISYWLARRLVRVEHIGMPNILLPPARIPELIQDGLTPRALARTAIELLDESSPSRQRIIEQCRGVRELLATGKPASLRVAEMALEMCRSAGGRG